MLADGGDALGKEAKNWLKRPVGREIKVTSGTGDGGVHLVGVSPPEGPYGQTASRMQGTWAVWPSSLLQAAHREPPCETGQEHGGVRSRRDSGSLAQKLGASVRRRDPAWVGGGGGAPWEAEERGPHFLQWPSTGHLQSFPKARKTYVQTPGPLISLRLPSGTT